MKASRITVGRLYNLGNFEHVKYEISVEIPANESATRAMVGIEKILEALKPESKCCVKTRGELDRELNHLIEMRNRLSLPEDEFRRHYGHFEGTPQEYYDRCDKMHAEEVKKRDRYEDRARIARELLDDLGGAAVFKDAKLDWDDSGDEDDL